jgi:hypothetical protein
MKDTWNDTGGEPDALTARETIWRSPYIWIRNSRDTDLTHQHHHQNPVVGVPNWVYVKLHNGGGGTSGRLKLYWAHASTVLSWPTDWALLTDVPVSSFDAHTTRIVEAEWSSLPAEGDYSLLARWVSDSDPMGHPETSDVNGNVRNNNNIAWRNSNIVDLQDKQSVDVSLTVRNLSRQRATLSFAIRPAKSEIRNSFIRNGRLTVQLDAGLMKAWRGAGTRARGIRVNGSEFVITDPSGATFENFLANGNFIGTLKLRFRKLPTTPSRSFTIDVAQFTSRRDKPVSARYAPEVSGGISYEIHTDVRDYGRK